jgi:hypothetical protein
MVDLQLADFVVSSITAVCALYISFVSMRQSAKPLGAVRLVKKPGFSAGSDLELHFNFTNRGRWYAKPPIVNLEVFVNFDPAFQLSRIRYGSILELENREVRTGKGGFSYLKASGLKIPYRGGAEPVAVDLRCPAAPGIYTIKIDAFSENGAAIKRTWKVKVARPRGETVVRIGRVPA